MPIPKTDPAASQARSFSLSTSFSRCSLQHKFSSRDEKLTQESYEKPTLHLFRHLTLPVPLLPTLDVEVISLNVTSVIV
eukprot:scaffold14388_cov186-Alexandrium_tamarense.AAC.20